MVEIDNAKEYAELYCEAPPVLTFDESPARWFLDQPEPQADVAGALNRDGGRRLNATAWLAAAVGVGTIIGGVIGFGLACAWILQSLP